MGANRLFGHKRAVVGERGAGGGGRGGPPVIPAKGAALPRITSPCNQLGIVREPPTLPRHNHNLSGPAPPPAPAPVLTPPLFSGYPLSLALRSCHRGGFWFLPGGTWRQVHKQAVVWTGPEWTNATFFPSLYKLISIQSSANEAQPLLH